jgi:SAM-dependent methyltransferase
MHLASGIPTIAGVEELKRTDWYARHLRFNRDFLSQHARAIEHYGRHWGLDPYMLWSRRWEYPFVAQRLIVFSERRPPGPLRILDAGSGVTYFPYFILENVPQAQFICCDYDPTYAPMFADINAARRTSQVQFLEASLQSLPLETQSLDAICCISVLEHTDNYGEIVAEFARVLRPGGLFVLTFDLSLDGKFTLPKATAAELIRAVADSYQMPDGFDPLRELDHMSDPGILTTDHVRHTEPQLLPWSRPARVYKAVTDLLQGRGWTGGFRSRTIFCFDCLRR